VGFGLGGSTGSLLGATGFGLGGVFDTVLEGEGAAVLIGFDALGVLLGIDAILTSSGGVRGARGLENSIPHKKNAPIKRCRAMEIAYPMLSLGLLVSIVVIGWALPRIPRIFY
jgi:hypothetical protein